MNNQNESLNTLGFITSQMRRNLVIGFFTILLVAIFALWQGRESDSDKCANKEEQLRIEIIALQSKLQQSQEAHFNDLKEIKEDYKQLAQRQTQISNKITEQTKEIEKIDE
jgi:septal ring factor EnvC (AmiA/AmiB activator)